MFKAKVVIVTGSSTGIGAGLAVRFAGEGANVVIHGRNESALQDVKKRCLEASGGNAKVHTCVGDISSDDVRQKLINETIQQFGQLDVLVNNAGIWDPSTFSESSMDLYDRLMDINVRAVIALTKLAAPHLIKSKGNIVNISSEAGAKAFNLQTFYCVTKAALDHFTKCLALELGPKGVRVNAVSPSYTPETDVLSRAGVTNETKEFYLKMSREGHPLRRTGTVEEVCDGTLFIASDKAKFCTGVILPVDGGSTIG